MLYEVESSEAEPTPCCLLL